MAKLSRDQMTAVRAFGLDLLKKYVPFKKDSKEYQEVTGSPGTKTWTKVHVEHTDEAGKVVVDQDSGTTCGFLCHWLMWQLGVTNAKILNWEDPRRKTSYKSGFNIDKIWGGKSVHAEFLQTGIPYTPPPRNPLPNLLESGFQGQHFIRPDPCDVVFIRSGKEGGTGHVFVFKAARWGTNQEGNAGAKVPNPTDKAWVWETAEAGQAKGGTDAFNKKRVIVFAGDSYGYTKITCGEGREESYGQRTIIGWLQLDKLDYDEERVRQIVGQTAKPLRYKKPNETIPNEGDYDIIEIDHIVKKDQSIVVKA